MDTAFQADAFQNDAFQIAAVVPVIVEEELKGGRRIYDPDNPTQYEELSQQTIDALFPPQPVTSEPVSALTPEMMAAVLAWMEED